MEYFVIPCIRLITIRINMRLKPKFLNNNRKIVCKFKTKKLVDIFYLVWLSVAKCNRLPDKQLSYKVNERSTPRACDWCIFIACRFVGIKPMKNNFRQNTARLVVLRSFPPFVFFFHEKRKKKPRNATNSRMKITFACRMEKTKRTFLKSEPQLYYSMYQWYTPPPRPPAKCTCIVLLFYGEHGRRGGKYSRIMYDNVINLLCRHTRRYNVKI